MSRAEQKTLQYLQEAHALELGLVHQLKSQILISPRGAYRKALEAHLEETRAHAQRVGARAEELGEGRGLTGAIVGLAQGVVVQVLALAKAPYDMLRGDGGEEKVLKSARDSAAAEALEIATYTALERFARSVGDEQTAELAASIRGEEERMLERVLRAIPRLAEAVASGEVKGKRSYDITQTGAADRAREIGESAKEATGRVQSKVRRTARGARKVPGVARTEGRLKGAVASAEDLAISGYDELTASEIVERLSGLSQVDLAKVQSYEGRGQKRSTILSRITALQSQEPWPGYDELNANEVRALLGEMDEGRLRTVRSYERSHRTASA